MVHPVSIALKISIAVYFGGYTMRLSHSYHLMSSEIKESGKNDLSALYVVREIHQLQKRTSQDYV